MLGAALSVVGLGIVMLSDADVGGGDSPRPVLGDSLVIVGTVFTATSNVSEVKSTPVIRLPVEFRCS
ncbi:hypothetical protein MLD38_004874 [Melastoma candidum]|uniref:Uncharacterized protein n=1 Tax=Melastoma candidum TaxID=119954 RepID=A0ACB9S7X8_9MYRT|nr:hypothetical protein MLD38_004874 [Melastoma candidum]